MKIMMFCLLFLLPLMAAAQQPHERITAEMSQMNAGLIAIALNTQYFLGLSEDIDLTQQQITQLQDLLYRSMMDETRLSADVKVIAAQVERLLANGDVDLKEIEKKLNEKYGLAAQVDFSHLKHALEAIQILTHEQHLKALPAFRKWKDKEDRDSGEHLEKES